MAKTIVRSAARPRRDRPAPDVERLVVELRRLTLGSAVDWDMPDLTLMQLRALFAIELRGSANVSALADDLGLSLASASALVDRLDRADLVRRHDDPLDRRRVIVSLTAAGAALAERVEAGKRARFRREIAAMTPRERAALGTALEALLRIRRAAREARR
jgi:DNA-binding MarR family transcriptional regulator